MIHTYTLPKSREEALHRSEMHLNRVRPGGPRSRFRPALLDALLGVGYAVMALSLSADPRETGEGA